ncbi:MAG: hypothetical protein KKB38_20625 [Gammaproteobacteria bacterium]|nr:hypothetical protein [Gammaproteobacteria bacterium]
MELGTGITVPPSNLPPALRVRLLGIQHEVLDRTIGMAEQRGKILRHMGTLAEVRVRLSDRTEALTEAQRLDLEGRKLLAEAAIAAGEVRILHWEAEVSAYLDLYLEGAAPIFKSRWRRFLERLSNGIH